MCGIAGYIGSAEIDRERLELCRGLMYRRGPDSSGIYHHNPIPGKHVYLLNSRLNIIDLASRANQPFHIGAKLLIYNGEIYNYLELKQELLRCGDPFTTTSDTEVLLRTLIRWDWPALDRCEGMWALALYDEADGSLLLSRDRFGEKPLYLYRDQTGLYFGSEIKFIAALTGHKLQVNYNHLYRYLVNGYKALYKVKETFFEGIEELPRASVLLIRPDASQVKDAYWNPAFEQDESLTYESAVSGVREALIHSVRLRLRADVPLAFCMSGGIDSNSLISIARNVLHYDVHGFTIVNTDARYEEQEMVNCSVRELGIRHAPIPLKTDGFLPGLRTLVRQHDAPVITTTYYAHWLLMASIADHGYRIAISGTAADEFFSGYYDHHNAYLYEVRDTPLYADSLQYWNEYIRPIVRNPFLQNPDLFIGNPQARDHIYLDANHFAAYLCHDWREPFTESVYAKGLMRNRMLNELFHEAVPPILHEDDLNAMYYSIENRSPFLDRALFDFCNRIPTRHLIRNGMGKAILRDAMREIVPQLILDNRRKVGFNAPIYSFLDVKDPEVRSYLLDESPIFDYVKREKIENLISKPDLPNSESKFLFYFLNSKMFLEEFAA